MRRVRRIERLERLPVPRPFSKVPLRRMEALRKLLIRDPARFQRIYAGLRLKYQTAFARLVHDLKEKCGIDVDVGKTEAASTLAHRQFYVKGITMKLPNEIYDSTTVYYANNRPAAEKYLKENIDRARDLFIKIRKQITNSEANLRAFLKLAKEDHSIKLQEFPEDIKYGFENIKLFIYTGGGIFLVPWSGQKRYWEWKDSKK